MARIDSLSILKDGTGKDALAEKYGPVIENLEQNTISGMLKNRDLSGNPEAGSVEAKRFKNATSATYGSARSAKKGTGVTAKPVTVKIDVDKEIIEEVEEKDVALYGVDNFINRRIENHGRSMTRELERAFFGKAKSAGTDKTTAMTGTTALEKFEQLVQTITTLKNDYIDGVDRDMIAVVMDEKNYGEMRTYMDTSVQNANVNSSVKEVGTIHGVRVYSSVYLPTGCTHIAMVEGSVAQPVRLVADEGGKIELSNAYHFGIFYSYGTEAVMPDCIMWANVTGE